MLTVITDSNGTRTYDGGQVVTSSSPVQTNTVTPTPTTVSSSFDINVDTPSGVYVPSTAQGGDGQAHFYPGAILAMPHGQQNPYIPQSTAYSVAAPNNAGVNSFVPPQVHAQNQPASNSILPSTGGVGGMIDKVAPVVALVVLLKIFMGIFTVHKF